jgi:hypothetical protein
MSFRTTVLDAIKHLRGHIQWTTCTNHRRRGGWYSAYSYHENRDAILRRIGKKSWEITLPSGTTFLKQEDSHGFLLVKTRPLKPKGYAILLKKRTAHPSTTT